VKPERPRYATFELKGSSAMVVAWVDRLPDELVFLSTVSMPAVTSDQNAPSGGLLLISRLAWTVLLIAKATVPARLLIASVHNG